MFIWSTYECLSPEHTAYLRISLHLIPAHYIFFLWHDLFIPVNPVLMLMESLQLVPEENYDLPSQDIQNTTLSSFFSPHYSWTFFAGSSSSTYRPRVCHLFWATGPFTELFVSTYNEMYRIIREFNYIMTFVICRLSYLWICLCTKTV